MSFVLVSFFMLGCGIINDFNFDLFLDLFGISGFLMLSVDVFFIVL